MNVPDFVLLFVFLGSGAGYSIRARKLTVAAALTGVLLALAVYTGAGFTGLSMMALFFFAGTAATSWRLSWKRERGLAENEKGTRSAGQVFANAGIAAGAGLAAFAFPGHSPLFQQMVAAAFAAATSDTLSSELGNIYGRRFYNIVGFRKGKRGLDGMISMEGSLWGLAGATLIAMTYASGLVIALAISPGQRISLTATVLRPAVIITISGTVGNLFDSLLGATWERRGWIGNDMVNFLNTLAAALCVWLGQVFFG